MRRQHPQKWLTQTVLSVATEEVAIGADNAVIFSSHWICLVLIPNSVVGCSHKTGHEQTAVDSKVSRKTLTLSCLYFVKVT